VTVVLVGFMLFGLTDLVRHPFAEPTTAWALIAFLQQQDRRWRIAHRVQDTAESTAFIVGHVVDSVAPTAEGDIVETRTMIAARGCVPGVVGQYQTMRPIVGLITDFLLG
jgi:hypothetical protein